MMSTDNIVGKFGEIYEYGDGTLGVMVLPDPPRRGVWVRIRDKFARIGITITQNGDQEGAAVFDPSILQQAQAAIDAIRARKIRTLSPERRAKLLQVGLDTRLNPGNTGQNPA